MTLNKIIYFFIIIFFTSTIFSNTKYEVLDKIIVKVGKQIITKQELEYEIRKKGGGIKFDASNAEGLAKDSKHVYHQDIIRKFNLSLRNPHGGGSIMESKRRFTAIVKTMLRAALLMAVVTFQYGCKPSENIQFEQFESVDEAGWNWGDSGNTYTKLWEQAVQTIDQRSLEGRGRTRRNNGSSIKL